jgi:hypothetical protein
MKLIGFGATKDENTFFENCAHFTFKCLDYESINITFYNCNFVCAVLVEFLLFLLALNQHSQQKYIFRVFSMTKNVFIMESYLLFPSPIIFAL